MEAASQTEGATPAASGRRDGRTPHGCEDVPAYGHCCPFYHEAIELVGRRWTGAIIRVLDGASDALL